MSVQVVPKWKVQFSHVDVPATTIFIHGTHLNNVLQQVALISLDREVIGISVYKVGG